MSNKKITLVIGASTNPERYSYKAIRSLKAHGQEVKAYGLRKGEVEGVIFETEKIPFENIDTVTLYVGPQNQEDLIDYIINDIKPRRIIFNPGTENPDFISKAEKAGIFCEVACTLVLLSIGHY
jgi:predicted CoA-binding protein|tara:strand:- start:11241 stop:11612 length:372 start_codon:yes stop_codon:yes gene_type:complete